jgi:hypothetical protein
MMLLVPNIGAQAVDRDELTGVGPVEFINFEGPHFRIDTLEQIRGIGYDLGAAVRAGINRPGALNRYFVIQSISPPDGNRLNADIFGIGADAAIDHIRNLRLIIQGYLEAAYQYSASDAALLAELVTIYNAVYRGDWDFFVSRYRAPVIGYLAREQAGLSLRYDEWPGQTLMLIPLGSGFGGPLSAVDSAAVSDERVIAQLREEDDMGLALRRDLVDFMEREANEANQQAEIIREAIIEEEQRLAQEAQDIQQQQQAAQQQQEAAQQELTQIAEARQDPDADQYALDQQEAAALQQQQDAEEQLEIALAQQEELAQQQEALEEQRQLADAHDDFAEQRVELAQEARQQIAEDQQMLLDTAPPILITAEGVLGTTILTYGLPTLGRIVRIDTDTTMELRRSPLTTVNVHTVTITNNRLLAIAGQNRGNSAVRLVEIDPATLQMIRQGENDIAANSLLWVNGQNLYAIVNSGDTYYMARFNIDFVQQARSAVRVHPSASVLFDGNYMLTQREDGTAIALNILNLMEK